MSTLLVTGDTETRVYVDDSPDCDISNSRQGDEMRSWGEASSCASSSVGYGSSRLDLMFTSFLIDTTQTTFVCSGWPNDGYIGSNGVVYSLSGRRAIITGGALCGWCWLSSIHLKPCDPGVHLLCAAATPEPTFTPTSGPTTITTPPSSNSSPLPSLLPTSQPTLSPT